MIETRELLKIGVFAKHANTNLRTLRYYEEVGLLSPAARSQGGFRYYRREDLNRVTLIRDLQELGLTLDEIGELIKDRSQCDQRSELMERVSRTLKANRELLSSRMEQLECQIAKLDSASEKLKECEECEVTPGPHNNHCEPCEKSGKCLPEVLSGLF